jgi:Uma2 family endonuclease
MTVATPQPRPRYTVQDYLRIEHDSTERHEYRDGEIVAMAGGTVAHSQIIANCIGELRNRLRDSSCNVFDSNLRVCISRGTLYSYPDATVICGRPELDLDDARGQTVTNPRLIVEVLSPGTEAFDRGEKFRRYLKIASFQEYVLVSQCAAVVETYSRQPDGSWSFRVHEGLEAVAPLASVKVDLPLAEVFRGVEFEPPPAEPAEAPPSSPPPGQ